MADSHVTDNMAARGANGARVLNWYRRQFTEAKHERYCVNDAQSKSLQGNLVDFFAGTWDNDNFTANKAAFPGEPLIKCILEAYLLSRKELQTDPVQFVPQLLGRLEDNESGSKKTGLDSDASPGSSRFANAGRPARTGMILTLFPDAAPVEAGQKPGRVPVNPDWLRFITVKPRRAPVYRHTAGTHRVYTGIRPRQSYGNVPVSPRSSPVMPRRSPGECRWHSGRAPRGYNTIFQK
ncbi:hypothetical protein DPMN_020653 [Dreissena polymorpha]|uniref:Uncharacterized protein n=1 Tax=Dreissena polymorpha TaxID=45954 RepID=A0A9D4S986_DREPO|nr:hypothetical protein DPMN_020653 [Dreissena polymorpha]